MTFRIILIAGTAAVLGAAPALAQGVLTQNINNTGIPRNAPSLGLSSIYGLNPCSSGAAVGVTTPLFGIGGAVADIDKDCETRNNAAVVITGLKDTAMAKEILCEIKDIREAARRIGKPCLEDQAAPKVASAAPEKRAQPETVAQAITPVAVSLPVRADAPVFCHVKGLDVSLYPECTTAQAPLAARTVAVKRPLPATGREGPPWALHPAAPVRVNKRTPDAGSGADVKNPSRAETVSYTPAGATGRPVSGRAAVAAPVAMSPAAQSMAMLLARGDAMVAAGDIVEARLFYERATDAGSGQAAAAVGSTYDPVFLARIKAVGIQADPATAAIWYRRAIALGNRNAASLLRMAAR